MPQILVNLARLKHNIDFFRERCRSLNLELVGVLKSAHSISLLVSAFQHSGIAAMAFSRVGSLERISNILRDKPLLIGLPSAAEAAEVVERCAASFNSEASTIQALARAAEEKGCRHGIYLMVDIGDLREGVPPKQATAALREFFPFLGEKLTFLGLAANLGCASGTLPDEKNLFLLQQTAEEIENQLGLRVSKISVGGTVVFPWILKHQLPSRINQLRIGEGILCGHCPGYDVKLEGLNDDVFLFRGKVLEYAEKVSPPPGSKGLDALGHPPSLGPSGLRKRAILDFGLIDTVSSGLVACLPGVRIVTSNSEYTIVDVTDCTEKIRVGNLLDFKTNYEAITQALASPFVEIIPVENNNSVS